MTRSSGVNLSTIADTVSGIRARHDPKGTIEHYEGLARHLWLPSQVQDLAEGMFTTVGKGQTAWGSLSGDYGFGKTSATIALWRYASNQGYLAIPPISCTSFDELAFAVASLAAEQAPKCKKKKIRTIFENTWAGDLRVASKKDAVRYAIEQKTARRLLEDKFDAGQLKLDGQCHRFVEFLSKLGDFSTSWSKGLIIILDELQQLLGPLDARAIIEFREFVWGFRTESSSCGIVISLDSMLEARMARWANDILHRIREQSPALQMSQIYTREFPSWLWNNLTTKNGNGGPVLDPNILTDDVIVSLGQFTERPDLANGPRTVVDVFSRASNQFQTTKQPYDLGQFVGDVRDGKFRYFGENALIQKILIEFSKDEWITSDEARHLTVSTLAAFPSGLPEAIWEKKVPSKRKRQQLRAELFEPLLVQLSGGLALEELQNVRRSRADWEGVLSRAWETLPSFDTILSHTPNYLWRIVLPLLFPNEGNEKLKWVQVSDDRDHTLTGWYRLRGTFDDNYPSREIGLWIGTDLPQKLPHDVDLCISLICEGDPASEADARIEESKGLVHAVLHLPVLKPLFANLPSELERAHKHIQPEPFNLGIILHAIHDIEAVMGGLLVDSEITEQIENVQGDKERVRARTFVKNVMEFVLREGFQGRIQAGKYSLTQYGKELVRALFTQACKLRFPQYESLMNIPSWRDIHERYRTCLSLEHLTPNQRRGKDPLTGTKAELLESLFSQTSSTVGDTYLRLLGSLIEKSGSPHQFELRFSQHPAEKALLEYAKRVGRNGRIPSTAAIEFLRHEGYLEAESNEVIQILVARELISINDKKEIFVIQNIDEARQDLICAILESQRQLPNLDPTFTKDGLRDLPLGKLQAFLGEITERRELVAATRREALEEKASEARQLIGTLTACRIDDSSASTEISQHLSGIADQLRETKDRLILAVRKHTKTIEHQALEADTTPTKSRRKNHSAFDESDKVAADLGTRVLQYTKRLAAFENWRAINQQLHSTRSLCNKLSQTEPEYLMALDRVTDMWREKFATDAWETLLNAKLFETTLYDIQSKVQTLIFSHLQTFNSESTRFCDEFGAFLQAGLRPVFEINEGLPSVGENYEKLYAWVLNGLRDTLEKCRSRKQSGERWNLQDSSRWSSLNAQADRSLEKCSSDPRFEDLIMLGTRVKRLVGGFEGNLGDEPDSLRKSYTNPTEPPDFKRLEKKFRAGEIIIWIEPKHGT